MEVVVEEEDEMSSRAIDQRYREMTLSLMISIVCTIITECYVDTHTLCAGEEISNFLYL